MTDMDLAREMAAAVLAGDEASAYALADLLSECRAAGASLAAYSAEKHPFAAEYVKNARAVTQRYGTEFYNLRRAAYRLHKRSVEERTALRIALSQEPESVRKNAFLGSLWSAWEPNFPPYAAGMLGGMNLVTPQEVKAKGRDEFGKISGIGPQTLKHLDAMLARHGLKW